MCSTPCRHFFRISFRSGHALHSHCHNRWAASIAANRIVSIAFIFPRRITLCIVRNRNRAAGQKLLPFPSCQLGNGWVCDRLSAVCQHRIAGFLRIYRFLLCKGDLREFVSQPKPADSDHLTAALPQLFRFLYHRLCELVKNRPIQPIGYCKLRAANAAYHEEEHGNRISDLVLRFPAAKSEFPL